MNRKTEALTDEHRVIKFFGIIAQRNRTYVVLNFVLTTYVASFSDSQL